MVKKVGVVLLILCCVAAVVGYLNLEALKDWWRGPQEVKVIMNEDPSLDELLVVLKDKDLIDDVADAKSQIESLGLETSKLEGGKYVLLSDMDTKELIEAFQRGDNGQGKGETTVNVTFNRCRDIEDVASAISKCIAADSTSIIEYLSDPKTLNKYGFTKEQMPALFIPDQYQMYFDMSAEEFVYEMSLKFKEFWNDDRKHKMRDLGFDSQSQVVTLASIVYSEQGKVPEEWPTIAKLYLNRLNTGEKLQSDPTFKFCWGDELDGVQRLLFKHRDIDCPYNTYKIDGLPPGPICLTPAKVIDAVLNPGDNDFIFMCAKPDYSGEHNFTKELSVHEANAKVYQDWLTIELEKQENE